MPVFRVILVVLAVLLPCGNAGLASLRPPSEAELRTLAADTTWRRLLHHPAGRHRSEINTKTFFLAEDGATNPLAELRATLAAEDTPWRGDPDVHPVCRFPARYFWLRSRLKQPDPEPFDGRCNRLRVWTGGRLPQSVSLMFVGGYMGNPASMFGHSILKLNRASGDRFFDFFDNTLNFGADIPPAESSLRYMLRGLTGGYQAKFSDRYFYSHDLVYSKIEAREMWEYRLRLQPEQLALLVLHGWELLGQQFDYYFLSDNCGYRIAELLELATDLPLTDSLYPWYLPVDTFYSIVALDADQRNEAAEGVLASIRYIPSQQRLLNYQFGLLSDADHDRAVALVEDPVANWEREVSGTSEVSRIQIVNALLAYYTFQKVSQLPEVDPEVSRRVDFILSRRLALPPAPTDPSALPSVIAPTEAPKPSLLAFGHSWRKVDPEAQTDRTYLLRYAPYAYAALPGQSQGGDRLVLMDLEAGWRAEQRGFLNRLTIIELRSLRSLTEEGPGDWRVPWQFAAKVRRQEGGSADVRYDGTLRAGTGLSQRFGERLWVFAMLDAALHNQHPVLRAEPNAGLQWMAGGLRAELTLRGSTAGRPVTHLDLEYQLVRDTSLTLEAEHAEADTVRLYLTQRF